MYLPYNEFTGMMKQRVPFLLLAKTIFNVLCTQYCKFLNQLHIFEDS